MTVEDYRNVVIGSGEGGKYLAWHLAKTGRRTIVVERRWIGGSCPNVNCLPSKNEIWSAKVAHLLHHAGRFGVSGFGIAFVTIAAERRRDFHQIMSVLSSPLRPNSFWIGLHD